MRYDMVPAAPSDGSEKLRRRRCHQSGQARSSAQFQDTAPPHAATFQDLRGSPWGNPWGNPGSEAGKDGMRDRDF